jgi:predicted O-linked N-acetylglucosamine transferase (SPINDLY family)
MGVPVVTLVGQTHGERTGYSILSHVGETRTVATSGKEYVDIAVRLATDRDFAREVRASLRARMSDPAVIDPRVYVRNLEKAYDAALAARGGEASGDGDPRAR